MKRGILGRWAVVCVAVVAAVGLASTTLALAVSNSSHSAGSAGYSACSNSKDELFVEVRGHCPAGTHHITLSARGPEGPTGAKGAPGATGATGPAGARGPAGENGTNGANGLSILTGSTAPSGSCTTGDSYIDDHYTSAEPAGEVYNCIASAWVDSGNSIEGPRGLPGLNGTNGTNGSNVLTGTTVPSGSCTTGDSYVDLTAHDALPAGEVYQCVASAWSDSGDTIQGPQGPAGITEGVSATSITAVPLTTMGLRVPVMSSPPLPANGSWFVSASITVIVDNTDYVACYINGEVGTPVPVVGPVTSKMYETLPLEAVVLGMAGNTISVICVGYEGLSGTEFYTGTIDATLISSPILSAAPIHRNVTDLRGTPPRL